MTLEEAQSRARYLWGRFGRAGYVRTGRTLMDTSGPVWVGVDPTAEKHPGILPSVGSKNPLYYVSGLTFEHAFDRIARLEEAGAALNEELYKIRVAEKEIKKFTKEIQKRNETILTQRAILDKIMARIMNS